MRRSVYVTLLVIGLVVGLGGPAVAKKPTTSLSTEFTSTSAEPAGIGLCAVSLTWSASPAPKKTVLQYFELSWYPEEADPNQAIPAQIIGLPAGQTAITTTVPAGAAYFYVRARYASTHPRGGEVLSTWDVVGSTTWCLA